MHRWIKRLGTDSLLYAFMNMGTKIVAFIMLPVYTRLLHPSEYGALDTLDSITAMLTFLCIFGTDSALAYFYFDTDNKEKRLKYVQNVMVFRVSVVLLFSFAVILSGQYLSILIFGDAKYTFALYLGLLVLLLDTVLTLVLTVKRFDFETVKVVTFTVLKMLLIAVLSYLFLEIFLPSIEAVLWARIVSIVIVLSFLVRTVFKYVKLSFNKTIMLELLKYGAPLVPASLSFWFILNSNRFFLIQFDSLESVGIYGAAIKYAAVITLLTSGIQMAWRPFSMSLKDKPNSKPLFAKMYMIILLAGMLGIMLVATIMPWVILLLDIRYYDAYKYVAIISSVTFLNFYYLIISVGLFFKKKTAPISIFFGIGAVVNLFLNFILVPIFSIWGAVVAYLVSFVIAVVLIFRKSQKVYHVPVSFFKMAYLFITTMIAVVLILYIQEHDNISNSCIILSWVFFIIAVLLSRIDKDIRKREPLGGNDEYEQEEG